MPEPRRLTLGVAPGCALRGGDGGIERDLAAQMAQQFGQAHSLHRRKVGVEVASGERRRLVEPARRQHRAKAAVASRIKEIARRQHQDRREAEGRRRRRPSLPRRDRDAGGAHHLVSARQPLRVPRRKTSCSEWVKCCKAFAEGDPAERAMQRCGLLPDFGWDLRDRRKALLQRPQIKSGAADDDR